MKTHDLERSGRLRPDAGFAAQGSLGLILVLALVTWSGRLDGVRQEEDPPPQPPDYSAGCTSSGCHDQMLGRASVHDPVASGDCDSCHEEVEGDEHAFDLLAPIESLCLECHEDLTEDLKYAHGPVAAGACVVCHDAHGSERSTLMIDEPSDLCLSCHTAMRERLATLSYQHDPATDDCQLCHDPHGGDNPQSLTMEVPALCLDCHVEIEDAMADAVVAHDAMTEDRSCANCHYPHASDFEKVLRRPPMDLCMSCHERPTGDEEDPLEGLGELLQANTNHHGPIREKDCVSCHAQIHGGSMYRLLLGAYPEKFYAPFEPDLYAFCFQCHEPDLVLHEQTDALTDFRNGTQNLHFLHVNRQPKGRTCRACHSTHASNNPRHVTESVPFGESNWRLPLNFSMAENGGSCLPGCHKQYSYDRQEAVVNIAD